MFAFRLIAALVALSIASGCKEDAPPAPVAPPAEEPAVAEADAGEEVHPLMQMRQAYGLPFPPEVRYVSQGPDYVEVGTMLSVDELEKFFRARVVDYEFIRPNKHELRLIGLHSTMPRVHVNKRAPNIPIAVRYLEQSASRDAARQAQAGAAPQERPVPGQPVRLKLGDKELAPGAVYGEPYTPQPGDPLYQDRYRANFGKPFGKWMLN